MNHIINKSFLKTIIKLIFLIIFFSCNDPIEIHISNTIIFEGKLFQLNSDTPYTGSVFNTYPNGQREYLGHYKNGRPNGKLIYWYKNGNKKREGKLQDGIPIGTWTIYNQNGSINETITH